MINIGSFIALLLYSALLCRAKKLKNKIVLSQSSENEEDRAIARRNRKREKSANVTFFIMLIAIVGVTLPPYILFNLNTVLLSALGLNPPPPAFTIIMIAFGNLYSLIFIMDPIVIMRNQDVREVVKSIIAKLRGRREKATAQNSSTLVMQTAPRQYAQTCRLTVA